MTNAVKPTAQIRLAVLANPAATVDDVLAKLREVGANAKRDTVATIRSDTLATLALLGQLQQAKAALTGAPVETAAPAVPKKVRKAKPPSRTKRWQDAAQAASDALSTLRDAMEELKGIQEEYSDWRDNLPENLQGSALAEKLNVVADLDLEGGLDDLENVIGEAEGADLPMGFGRD